MKSQWIWLWSLGLLALAANNQTRAQDPDKGDSGTQTIKDKLLGSEPRDRVRALAPHRAYDHKLLKGKTYLIDLMSADFDPYLRLEDPRGVQVAADDDSGGNLNAQISYRAEETGTFRLIATGYGRGTQGTFTLTVRTIAVREAKPSDLSFADGTATIKDKVTADDGTDRRGRHYKAYTFAGKATKLYRVELQGLVDAQLRLQDDLGRVLRRSNGSAKGEATLVFRPKRDSTYRLLVGSGRSGKTGDFRLSVTPGVPRQARATTIDPGKPIKLEAQLTSEDGNDREGKYCRIYKLQAVAGKEYRFEARGKVDPALRLEDANGKGLQEEDYGDAGYSHLTFRPSKTGIYHLVLAAGRADQTGPFTLTGGERSSLAINLPLATEPTRMNGQLTKEDELDSQARYQKTYAFKGEARKIYRFEVVGDFVAYLGVEAVMEQPPKDVMMIPPQALPASSRRIYVPARTGTHYLTVAASSGQLGAYTLTASVLNAKLAKVTAPKYREVTLKVANLAGTLTEDEGINTNGQPYQLIALKTEPKKLYDVKLIVQPGPSPPMLRLEGLKGEVLRNAQWGPGNSLTLSYPSAKTAEYRLAIIGILGQNTKYNLTITESDYTPPIVKVEKLIVSAAKPAIVTNQLTLGDPRGDINKFHKVYSFEAQQGKTYQLDLHSNAFDAYLYLKDANDLTLMENDDNGESLDSRILFTMKKTGTYKIIATSLGGAGTGPYTLTVREVGAAPPK